VRVRGANLTASKASWLGLAGIETSWNQGTTRLEMVWQRLELAFKLATNKANLPNWLGTIKNLTIKS
jgi:hypothetical protein